MSNIEPAPNVPGPDHRATTTPNKWITSPEARQYIYLAVAIILAGLVVFGLITEEQIAEWVRITLEILAVGATLLAARNVPTK